jgi:hypothetical protein
MAEKEARNFASAIRTATRSKSSQIGNQGMPLLRLQGLYRYRAKRTGNQKSAYIYRREETGKETQGWACLDARQDLEANCKKGWNGETGRSRNHYCKGSRCQASQVVVFKYYYESFLKIDFYFLYFYSKCKVQKDKISSLLLFI